MIKTLANLSAILLILVSLSAMAGDDAVRNVVEKSSDRRALVQDKTALLDDQADLNRLSDLAIRLDALRNSGASDAEIRDVQHQIAVELRRDIAENRVQTAQVKREVAQSRREIRSDRREIREDRANLREARTTSNPRDNAEAKRELRDDRRDRRDDRRDYRDDVRDLKTAEQVLERKRALAREMIMLQHAIDKNEGNTGELQDKQEALLNRYLALSHHEVQMGFREIREDRRELREDRRETRENRREANP
ncbi:MAG: hypothetical protein HRF51_10900 [bacterium]